jgi:hypothetical protein
MHLDSGASSADREPGMEFKDTPGGGFGRVEPTQLCVRSRQQNVCGAPVGIGLEGLVRRLRCRLELPPLEVAEANREPGGVAHRIERAQAQRPLAPLDPAVRIANRISWHQAAKPCADP